MNKGSRARKKQDRAKKQPSGGAANQQEPTTEETPAATPVTHVQAAPPAHALREPGLEDGFFARGEEEASSVPPASFDTDIEEPLVRSRPEIVERRARFRRLVLGVVGAAAALTLVVSAR